MKIGVFSTFMSAQRDAVDDQGTSASAPRGSVWSSIWMGEHVALFDKNTFGYPGSKDGRIPVPPGGGMLDVTATFGFLAAATKQSTLRHRCRARPPAQPDLHRQGGSARSTG